MSQSTPPKSKTTARRSLGGITPSVLDPRPALHRGRPLVGVRRERDPSAVLHALLVQHLVLRARRPVALEVCDRVVPAGLVPLLLRLGAARAERERDPCEEED